MAGLLLELVVKNIDILNSYSSSYMVSSNFGGSESPVAYLVSFMKITANISSDKIDSGQNDPMKWTPLFRYTAWPLRR